MLIVLINSYDGDGSAGGNPGPAYALRYLIYSEFPNTYM